MQFHIEELIARVNIQLKDPAEIKNKNIISYGDIELNRATSRLTCKNTGDTVELVCKEFQLLEYFMRNPNICNYSKYRGF